MPPISKAPLLELILNSQRIKGGLSFFLFVLRKPSLPSKQFPGSCCGNAQTPAEAVCEMCLRRQFGIFGNKHRQALLTAHRIHSPLSEQALEQEATTKNSFLFQQVCSTRGKGNRWKWCSTIKDNLRYQHLHKCSGSHTHPAPQGPLCHRLPCSNQIWQENRGNKPTRILQGVEWRVPEKEGPYQPPAEGKVKEQKSRAQNLSWFHWAASPAWVNLSLWDSTEFEESPLSQAI